MKFLRNLVEEAKVDLTDRPSRNEVADAWPYGVTYNGRSVFKDVYEGNASGVLESALKTANRDLRHFDFQESYLGYVPSEDMFVMGFDTWAEEDRYGDSYDVDDTVHALAFRLVNGVVRGVNPVDLPGRMMYPEGLRALHKKFSDLIDVRLD